MNQFMLIDFFGGKKFVLTVIIEAAAIWFTHTGLLSIQEFVDFSKWILGIYGVTNVADKFSPLLRQIRRQV